MVSLLGGISAGPSGAGLTSASIDKVMGSTGGVSSLGGYPNDEGMVSCALQPAAAIELDSVSLTSAMVGGVPLWDHHIPAYSCWGSTSQVQENILLIKGECPLTCCFSSTMLIAKGQ